MGKSQRKGGLTLFGDCLNRLSKLTGPIIYSTKVPANYFQHIQ
jgi:hypothetical protein